jgi:hypothetical protein
MDEPASVGGGFTSPVAQSGFICTICSGICSSAANIIQYERPHTNTGTEVAQTDAIFFHGGSAFSTRNPDRITTNSGGLRFFQGSTAGLLRGSSSVFFGE